MENIDWSMDRSEVSIFEPHEGHVNRPKSPYRLRYSAEVAVLKKTFGDLEEIRQKMGLSRRKICQLLMVDPSAWTRWEKTEAPPHIYKTLGLMMQMNDEKKGFVDPILSEKVKALELQLNQALHLFKSTKPARRAIWPWISIFLSLVALGLSVFLGFYATSVLLAN
jgi:transcriptional regulator with XRE-family HTH domain